MTFKCPENKVFPSDILVLLARQAIKKDPSLFFPFWYSCKKLYNDPELKKHGKREKKKIFFSNLIQKVARNTTFIIIYKGKKVLTGKGNFCRSYFHFEESNFSYFNFSYYDENIRASLNDNGYEKIKRMKLEKIEEKYKIEIE
jgi:hypothetical protein